MAANPALVRAFTGELVPAPYPGEVFLLKRSGMQLDIDSVRTASGKWSCKGVLFLSNVRLVFLGDKPDASGLAGFDLPLVYLRDDTLVQPIFGCNHLRGQVWPAAPGGGPAGSLPPHDFKLYFREGGIGTFYPLYYVLASRAKSVLAAPQAPQQSTYGEDPNPASYAESLLNKAFVDPNDPSTLYLSQPTDESQKLPERPKYAANYGQEEVYEAMDAPTAGQVAPMPGRQ